MPEPEEERPLTQQPGGARQTVDGIADIYLHGFARLSLSCASIQGIVRRYCFVKFCEVAGRFC
jgi:hypothetical protein